MKTRTSSRSIGIRNQKCAERRQRLLERLQKDTGGSHDYSNNDLCNVINIDRNARTIIISKHQECEEAEAYCHSSNYHIINDHQRQVPMTPKPALQSLPHFRGRARKLPSPRNALSDPSTSNALGTQAASTRLTNVAIYSTPDDTFHV